MYVKMYPEYNADWSHFQDTIRYSLIGDDSAKEFFYINPTTGEISLKTPLSEGDSATYTVCTVVIGIGMYCRHRNLWKKNFIKVMYSSSWKNISCEQTIGKNCWSLAFYPFFITTEEAGEFYMVFFQFSLAPMLLIEEVIWKSKFLSKTHRCQPNKFEGHPSMQRHLKRSRN